MKPVVLSFLPGLLAATTLLLGSVHPALALPIPEAPSFPSHSYILMGHNSGQVLAASNPDKHVEPASITKLMTTYIVFDEIKKGNLALTDMVTVSEKAWRMGGSKMFIEVGKKISVDHLLQGVIAISGNDATVALAEHVAGSVDTFAAFMNQYAAKLGLADSHFVNATGWPADNHYMSARDMATLASALIADFPKLYARYFAQKKFTWNDIEQYNRNSLLWTDKSVDGLKTGHTQAAGYCLVTSAEREGMRLIAVVTGTDSENARESASAALLNYGFRFFETHLLFEAGKPISTVPIWKGAQPTLPIVADGAVYVTAPRGGIEAVTTAAALPARIVAPVQKGQELGLLKIAYKGEPLHQAPLYAGAAVPLGGIFSRLWDEFLLIFQ